MTSPETEPDTLKAPALSNLAEALSSLQRDLVPVARDTDVTVKTDKGSYSYSFADLAAITRMLYPLLGKLGLSFTAAPTMNERGQFVLRYKLLHDSGEFISGEYPLPTDVKSPQAMGSAITYARRYCLCAVTGVVTDDDDGAAAQHAAREQSAQPADPERADAVNRVAAAWNAQYGSINWDELGAAYTKWSNGKNSRDANAADLRRFAGYLSALPAQEAGTDPSTPPASEQKTAAKITPRQRGKLFALMGEIGLHEKGEQLRWINKTLPAEYESRSLITYDDAQVLIKGLEKGIDANDAPPPNGEPA